MRISPALSNRLGFVVLGLTNNFAYVVMLSAAYDLLKQSTTPNTSTSDAQQPNVTNSTKPGYCLQHSTSTILLADTLPSLATKILYPFALVGLPGAYKAIATAILSAASFIITGLTATQVLIFTGVVCASFSSGLGEATFLSNTPLYGDASLSGWSMGTGAAGLVGSMAYAVLREIMSIRAIMMTMLIVPLAMMFAYFRVIKTTADNYASSNNPLPVANNSTLDLNSRIEEQQPTKQVSAQDTNYGTETIDDSSIGQLDTQVISSSKLRERLLQLPGLAKYFLPLLLVYFAEYFINQGLFEIIYYPEVTALDHAAQYRWFQVTYQLGVMISRSSLDFLKINNIWAMSILQAANAILFLAHASKLIHLPSFYLVIALIVYEGLLGGFTYVNTFYRIKKEVQPDKQEFSISAVTMADSLGIVMAGLVAIPVHDSLCKLYV